MKIIYRIADYNEVAPFSSLVKKERVTMENPEGATWFVAEDIEENKIVGFACIVISKTRNARFKSDYVLKEYRGNGIYENLFTQRLKYAALRKVKKASAFCTSLSLGCYMKYGFSCISKKKDITFVARSIKK